MKVNRRPWHHKRVSPGKQQPSVHSCIYTKAEYFVKYRKVRFARWSTICPTSLRLHNVSRLVEETKEVWVNSLTTGRPQGQYGRLAMRGRVGHRPSWNLSVLEAYGLWKRSQLSFISSHIYITRSKEHFGMAVYLSHQVQLFLPLTTYNPLCVFSSDEIYRAHLILFVNRKPFLTQSHKNDSLNKCFFSIHDDCL